MPPEASRTLPTLPPGILSGQRLDPGSAALVEWLAALRAAGVRRAGPALLLALDALRRADVSPSRRVSVLRFLKSPLLKTCAGLPKPWPTPGQPLSGRRSGVTLEQRLYRQMFVGLKQTLYQLDRCYPAIDGDQTRKRDWIVRNLFRFFDREIRYSALWATALSRHAWSDLHELFVYLMVRRRTEERGAGPPDGPAPAVDPATEYKQQLLFGLAARVPGPAARSGALTGGLRKWAEQTMLADPQAVGGREGLFVVELSEDAPPRRCKGPLDPSFRGWLLSPPEAFLIELERAERGAASGTPARQVESAAGSAISRY